MDKTVKLSDIVLMSDVDGTLVTRSGVPQRNIEAINRFIKKGGRFGIATGRSVPWVRDFVHQLGVNVPCVLFNGGMLYDFEREEVLMNHVLPEKAKAYVDILMNIPVPVSLLVMTRESYRNIGSNPVLARGLLKERNNGSIDPESPESVLEDWHKILIFPEKKDHAEVMAYLNKQEFPGARITTVSYTLIEMLPEISSKGYALEQLILRTGISRGHLAVIGDFYNDVEMIEMAGIGATLCDSPQDIKNIADVIVGTCENGAVADLIEYLEEKYE